MTTMSIIGQGHESPLLKSASATDDFDQEKELEFLSNLTKQVHEKFIQQWTGVHLEKLLNQQAQEHIGIITQQKAKVTQLQEQIKNLQTQKESNKRLVESQCEELQEIRAELKQIVKETDALVQSNNSLVKAIKEMEKENEKQKHWITNEGKSSEIICQELERAMDLFKKNLSLQLRRVSDNRLQMILTSIDNKDPSRPFCVCVRINPDRSYSISDCEPKVPNLDDLVQKLNESNNFRAFMICLRRSFKAMV